jgi:hypothetical protein
MESRTKALSFSARSKIEAFGETEAALGALASVESKTPDASALCPLRFLPADLSALSVPVGDVIPAEPSRPASETTSQVEPDHL